MVYILDEWDFVRRGVALKLGPGDNVLGAHLFLGGDNTCIFL